MSNSDMVSRTVLITGASRGIGLATACRLANAGNKIIGLSRRAPESFPGVFYEADLNDTGMTAQALEEIVKNHEIDAVINNAGLTTSKTLEEEELHDFDAILAVNLKATFHVVRSVLPSLKRHGNGRIVNISSRASLGMARRSAYAAAKIGVIGLTRTWALELGRYGIRVNAVAPGPIATELYTKNNPMNSAEQYALQQRIPLKRIGEPDDVAGVVNFLLSEESSFMTGQVLYVCGGLSVGAQPV